MSKLKTFPVDLLGTAPSNKVSGEVRVIERNEDRIFIPTGGPFYTKSLKMWAGSVPLTPGVDFKGKELNRNGTIDSGKEVCNAIQILNKGTTFTYEYQVIGGEYAELGEELADFIKSTPINDLTKIHWNNILYKPTTFPPSPHTHVANEWLGYGDSIWIVEQLTAGLTTGRDAIYNAVKEEAKRKIEEYVQEYIDRYGVVVTDSTPTNNGNVFLVGNGKQPTPLKLDTDALFHELDTRYFRNVINPLTRVGVISDSFLPITTGFFNVTTPRLSARWTAPAGYVEKNGNLVCLLPATDGEVIRYVYGYVREWTTLRNINGYKATNQQYRPPGLAPDEEIMEIMGSNDQCMIGTISTISSTGAATFKEHCIIELNGTLIQDSHVLTRLGSRLVSAIGNGNPDALWSYQPHVVRMRDRKFYFVAVAKTGTIGTLSGFKYDPVTDVLSKITNWTGKLEQTRLRYNPNGLDDTFLSRNTTVIKTGQEDLRPAAWFKHQAVDGEDYVLDQITPDAGYSFYLENYGQNLMVSLKGDDILTHWSPQLIHTFSGPTGWLGNVRAAYGRSMSIRPDKQEYTWLRTSCEGLPETQYCTNNQHGHIVQLGDKRTFEFKIPFDHVSSIHIPSAYRRSNIMSLQDGNMIVWNPPSNIGELHHLSHVGYGTNDFSPEKLYNSYYIGRTVRDAPNPGRSGETIFSDKLNLENPSPIPLAIAAYPMNNGLVLIQEGNHAYIGGPTSTNYYIYRPSNRLVAYRTLDAGAFTGYDTSDDRIQIASNVPTRTWSATRRPDGTCNYSSMVFQSNIGTLSPPMEQTVYQDVKLDYANGRFVESTAYKLTEASQSAVLFALRSAVGDDIHSRFRVWALIISPLQPDVAMFQAEWASADAVKHTKLVCAAKLTWNANRELVSMVIRPAEGEMSSWNPIVTYLWDIGRFRTGGAAALEYNANLTEGHWHVRHLISMGVASTNTTGNSAVHSYKLTFGGDGFPKLTRYSSSVNQDGYKLIVASPQGTALMSDEIGMGVYRVAKPMLNWNWVSGTPWSEDTSKFFAWYTPRPTVSFKLRVIEDIEIQIGGVYSAIPRGNYELTDPRYSTITDPKNKTILIYASLLRGQAILEFVEYALPESVYTTYLGKCITDEYGVTEADIQPLTRIGNYRASTKPQGMAFSASSGTANIERLLNWDADIPATLVSERVRGFINGADNLNQGASIVLAAVVTPEDTVVVSRVWTSLDTSIATVDQNGVVKGIRAGQVTIKCLINDEVTATKNVTIAEVKKVEVPITGNTSVDGAWKIIPSVDLLDTFRKYTGRDPKTGEEVNFTVPAGYAVIANSTAVPAINVNNWPEFTILTMAVDGAVVGRGGQGARVNPGSSVNIVISVIAQATPGGTAIKSDNTPLHIANKGTIAGGGGGGGGGRWQRAGGGGGGAPYGLAGSGHYDWTSGGLCLPGELLVGGDGGRLGDGGRNGGRGGAWGMQGSWADANGTKVPPGNAGVALQGSNITVTNVGAGVVKGS
jgi:hypothetical protein